MRRIQAADGDDVVAAMKEIAERALPAGVTSAEDFEQLVGAFGAESRTLSTLETLASLTSPADRTLRRTIRRVASFSERVRDNGVSHVLEVICERTSAHHDDAGELHALVSAIVDSFDGRVVFGNLNYDTLLLAALMHVCRNEDLADLADGRTTVTVTVNDKEERDVPALRATAADFPRGRRVRLLHLHGSLTYWANRDRTIYAKLPKDLLDDGAFGWGAEDGESEDWLTFSRRGANGLQDTMQWEHFIPRSRPQPARAASSPANGRPVE